MHEGGFVTATEARAVLELADGQDNAAAVRAAYVRRMGTVTVESDPEVFACLREALEVLGGAPAPPPEVTAARARLNEAPTSAEARRWLLSCLPYHGGPDAFTVLLAGAEGQPDEFVDELLLNFPERAPAGLLKRAESGAGQGRWLLISDAHAAQARPSEALAAYRQALAASASPSLRLAIRPVLSLHARAQVEPAREMFALLKRRSGEPFSHPGARDGALTRSLRIVEELDRLDQELPLDLRLIAARAAKSGSYQNGPTEAFAATQRWPAREVKRVALWLRKDAPTLAGLVQIDVVISPLAPMFVIQSAGPESCSEFL